MSAHGIEWRRLRRPLEGVGALGEWRRARLGSAQLSAAQLLQRKRRERRGFAAVGGVSRVDWGQGERGVRRNRVVGLPFMGDGFQDPPWL